MMKTIAVTGEEKITVAGEGKRSPLPKKEKRSPSVSDDGAKLNKPDRFLISSDFEGAWKNLGAKVLDRKWSDHASISLYDFRKDFGQIPFKFYGAWLEDKSLEDVVKKAWGQDVKSTRPDCRFKDKLNNVKHALKLWRKESGGMSTKTWSWPRRRYLVGKEKSEVHALKVEDRVLWKEARKKWLDLEEKSVAIARQKAKIKWIKDGDENSKFFHIASIGYAWLRKISREEGEAIEQSFTEEEVSEAIKGCDNNKSPGLDSFTMGFLKKFWYLIKADLILAFEWYWKNEQISKRWIEACLSSSMVLVPVNGFPTMEFPMERGLRQGDPLSPFFFLIVAEGLHIMTEKAETKGLIKGVKVGKEEVRISHLQYADNVILFREQETENIKNLVKVLGYFYVVSWLKINLRKSKLYGVGVTLEEVQNWAKSLGCEGVVLKREGEDRVVRKLDPSGDFLVGALRGLIEEVGERRGSNGPKISWLKPVPKKICIFIWRLMLGRLSIRVELDRRGVDLDSVLCPSAAPWRNRFNTLSLNAQ
ncbi:hypothetical protein OSB04_023754, partial [Centaurea solstitialis]